VLWLAQRTDRTSVATLMRCGWETVTAIINRGVADLLDTRRLQALYRIGVDEVCYRHPHRYLTIVGDHDTGTVIDIQPGRSEESLANFYQSQPDSIVSQIEVVSMDVSKADSAATRTHAPQATICYDPFHIMQWVNRALDRVYAEAATGPGRAAMSTPDWKATRWALRTGDNKLSDDKRALVNQIARTNRRIGRAWTLNEQLRDVYRTHHPPGGARQYLRRWIIAAGQSDRAPAGRPGSARPGGQGRGRSPGDDPSRARRHDVCDRAVPRKREVPPAPPRARGCMRR